jgi:hypothetical protein
MSGQRMPFLKFLPEKKSRTLVRRPNRKMIDKVDVCFGRKTNPVLLEEKTVHRRALTIQTERSIQHASDEDVPRHNLHHTNAVDLSACCPYLPAASLAALPAARDSPDQSRSLVPVSPMLCTAQCLKQSTNRLLAYSHIISVKERIQGNELCTDLDRSSTIT